MFFIRKIWNYQTIFLGGRNSEFKSNLNWLRLIAMMMKLRHNVLYNEYYFYRVTRLNFALIIIKIRIKTKTANLWIKWKPTPHCNNSSAEHYCEIRWPFFFLFKCWEILKSFNLILVLKRFFCGFSFGSKINNFEMKFSLKELFFSIYNFPIFQSYDFERFFFLYLSYNVDSPPFAV